MRYVGQGHEISVPVPDGVLGGAHFAALTQAFEEAYRFLFGRTVPDVPIEVIHWRLAASGPQPEMNLRLAPLAAGCSAAKRARRAYFAEPGCYIETPVYDRYTLHPGAVISGPAIVEERESTLIIGSRGRGKVDGRLNVIVSFIDA
jgi:N-methylhydantoinase A